MLICRPSRRRSRRSSPRRCIHAPALTESKEPAGGVASPFEVVLPQQATEPSLLTPQVWVIPGAHGVEGTRGRRGLTILIPSPSRRRRHCSSPRRCGHCPALDGIEGTRGRQRPRPYSSRSPQQATEPSLLNPQVCHCPALTETNEPAGGAAAGHTHLLPQQATEPLLLTPAGVALPGADGDEGTHGAAPLVRRCRSGCRACPRSSGSMSPDSGGVVCTPSFIVAPAGDRKSSRSSGRAGQCSFPARQPVGR